MKLCFERKHAHMQSRVVVILHSLPKEKHNSEAFYWSFLEASRFEKLCLIIISNWLRFTREKRAIFFEHFIRNSKVIQKNTVFHLHDIYLKWYSKKEVEQFREPLNSLIQWMESITKSHNHSGILQNNFKVLNSWMEIESFWTTLFSIRSIYYI